ncbi:MAG: GNAT family N-acetyltransferase [Alphaproteobacteria bacterium]|nr:GNAT family N-acetyltransferase [Alphaproteobacteria bacterium]
MIEVIQTGQSGKTLSLIEMHRLRKVIFRDRMQWNVDISKEGLEIDNYDLPETVYILARDQQNRVVGVWRILPSTLPSMVREIWPEFIEDFPLPVHEDVWEASRFGVYSYAQDNRTYVEQTRLTTAHLISALAELCVLCGIQEIFTLYNPQVGRAVRPLGFIPEAISAEHPVDGKPTIVGRFRMNEEMLARISAQTGVLTGLTFQDLPPILQNRMIKNSEQKTKEYRNAYA